MSYDLHKKDKVTGSDVKALLCLVIWDMFGCLLVGLRFLILIATATGNSPTYWQEQESEYGHILIKNQSMYFNTFSTTARQTMSLCCSLLTCM